MRSSCRLWSPHLGLVPVCLVLFTTLAFAQRILNLPEGASCDSDKVCMKFGACRAIHRGSVSRLRTCSYDRNIPIKCCSRPDPVTTAPGAITNRVMSIPGGDKKQSVSDKMCKKYGELVRGRPAYDTMTRRGWGHPSENFCGKVHEALIVGGDKAALKEFPHMVQIGYGSKRSAPTSDDSWLCGGSLISERFVLSADHCTYFKPTPGQKKQIGGMARWARMGIVDTKNQHGIQPQIFKIVEWINKTGFPDSDVNDIVLFKLEEDVTFNAYVRPICLQVNKAIDADSATAIGFGKRSEGALKTSSWLRKVMLNLVDNHECGKSYTDMYAGGIPDSLLCAGGVAGKDTCQGDSGGPLQISLETPYCMHALVGITSLGKQCGSSVPAIYTRVSKYVPWIEKIVWPDEK